MSKYVLLCEYQDNTTPELYDAGDDELAGRRKANEYLGREPDTEGRGSKVIRTTLYERAGSDVWIPVFAAGEDRPKKWHQKDSWLPQSEIKPIVLTLPADAMVEVLVCDACGGIYGRDKACDVCTDDEGKPRNPYGDTWPTGEEWTQFWEDLRGEQSDT